MRHMHNDARSPRPSRRRILVSGGFSAAALMLPGRASAQARTPTAQERANMKVVDDFLVAWNRRDAAGVASFLSPAAKFAAARPGQCVQRGKTGVVAGMFVFGTRVSQAGNQSDHAQIIGHT